MFLFCERNYYFAIKKRIFHEKCVKCLPTVRRNLHETEMLKTYGNRTRQLKFYTKNDTGYERFDGSNVDVCFLMF